MWQQYKQRSKQRNGFQNARVLNNSSDESQRFETNTRQALDQFIKSGVPSFSLPAMTREQRKKVHEIARRMRLQTKSAGEEPNRYIVITLRNAQFITKATTASTQPIVLDPTSVEKVSSFVQDYPITHAHVQHFLSERANSGYNQRAKSHPNLKQLIPPVSNYINPELERKRKELPSFKYKNEILSSLQNNNVVIISGGTGCGKTTQVPQFILEDAAMNKKPIRIMCTQPRRIAAISIAERVCKERGEKIGDTVGYHIRLEQKTSDNTILTYCTSGVLLRMLSADSSASGITHIILDEIHERETNTDYLLIALKQAIEKRNDLKVILMSATIEGNMKLFKTYFKERVKVIKIESKLFEVKKLYLGDVLAMVAYEPEPSYFGYFNSAPSQSPEDNEFPSMDVWEPKQPEPMQVSQTVPNFKENWQVPTTSNSQAQFGAPNSHISMPNIQPPQGTHMSHSSSVTNSNGEWIGGSYQTIDGDIISESCMNSYMAAMGGVHERPIVLNSSVAPPTVQGPVPPYQSTSQQQQQSIANVKQSSVLKERPNFYVPTEPEPSSNQQQLLAKGLSSFSTGNFGQQTQFKRSLEEKYRMEMKNALPNRQPFFTIETLQQLQENNVSALMLDQKYLMCGGDQFEDSVDCELVSKTIEYCADSPIRGSILVFLPGYEDIMKVREKMEGWMYSLKNYSLVKLLCLHSQMNSMDQNEVFRTVSRDVRKVILSTNIAEASVTIEDVVFVIDTGKVKEKVYNHDTKFSQLKVSSIAKSNSEQRAGRAGRVTNGFCFRLYSQKQYMKMAETQLAEMQRSAIYDVCLHAKLFAPFGTRVIDFLSLAPEPPPAVSIEQSMKFLEQLGALYSENTTSDELPEGDYDTSRDPELTCLGRIMAQMPLDPQLSRLLIFGLTMKCLTPIANLVALLSYRDPFIIASSLERENFHRIRERIGKRDFSDHLFFIRLVDEYSRLGPKDYMRFCRDNYLNHNTMRMVLGVRRQLLMELKRAKLIETDGRDVLSALNDAEYNRYSNCWPMVQAAISAGCYPSVGVSIGNSNKLRKIQTHAEKNSGLHPSSVIKRQTNMKNIRYEEEPDLQFVVYQEMSLIDGGLTLRTVTVIPPLSVLLFTGPIRIKYSTIHDYQLINEIGEEPDNRAASPFCNGFESYEIEDWYAIKAQKKDLKLLLQMRLKFMHYFMRALVHPYELGVPSEETNKMLEVISVILKRENHRCRFGDTEMPTLKNLRTYEKAEAPAQETNFYSEVSYANGGQQNVLNQRYNSQNHAHSMQQQQQQFYHQQVQIPHSVSWNGFGYNSGNQHAQNYQNMQWSDDRNNGHYGNNGNNRHNGQQNGSNAHYGQNSYRSNFYGGNGYQSGGMMEESRPQTNYNNDHQGTSSNNYSRRGNQRFYSNKRQTSRKY